MVPVPVSRTTPTCAEKADSHGGRNAQVIRRNEFGIWWRIVMPLSKPALAAVAIFAFRDAWDNFLAPLIYLAGAPNLRPLAVGLYTLRGGGGQLPDTHYLMALSTLMVIPMLLMFALGQRYFIRGVTLSGIKG